MATSFHHERDCLAPVVGVDEAGRGPLAGPVVAAAVVLDRRRCPRGIDDSKKLCAEVRERIAGELHVKARVGIGVADVEEIDRLNIFWAAMLAMTRAVEALGIEPGHILVDGNALPRWRWTARAIVGGDALSRSIAAASIVAKVARDRMMRELDVSWPGYGWASNKGYGTQEHRDALTRLGPTPLHRRSFAPVAQLFA
ncbi:MAG: ribonuclease HII [Sphingomonadaceae bacterium]|nr:ribonuclease HII [Sphingomonadaceae bacterium]